MNEFIDVKARQRRIISFVVFIKGVLPLNNFARLYEKYKANKLQ